MSKIRMIAPSGNTGDVSIENAGNAFSDGYKLTNNDQQFKMLAPSGNIGNVKASNLHNALNDGYQFAKHSYLDRAKEFGQGVAEGLGTIPDIANKFVGAPIAHLTGYAADAASHVAGQVGLEGTSDAIGGFAKGAHDLGYQYQNSNLGKELASNESLQTDVVPDETSNVLKAAGSTATDLIPFALASKGVALLAKKGGQVAAPWLTRLNEMLQVDINAKNAISFAGMGAGSELAKSKDPNTTYGENLLREVAGGIVGGITAPALADKPLKAIYKLIRNPIESTKNVTYSALSTIFGGNKLNNEAINAAEKLGVQLTPKELSNSNISALTQNITLNSSFTSKIYREVLENSPKKLIESINETLSKVGSKIASTESESALASGVDEYQNLLKQQNIQWRGESKKLYDNAVSLASDKDKLIAKNTKSTVDDLVKSLSFGVSKPEGEKLTVLNKLENLKVALKKPVNIRDLFQERSDLFTSAGELFGHKELLKSVASTIEKDIDSFKGNKAFTDAWKGARKYNQEMIQTRVKTNTAKKILSAEQPTEALKYMNNATDVRKMEKIIGTDLKGQAGENAKLLMGKLKRARIDQYFKTNNIITADDNFNANAFVRIFERNVDEDFLKSLIGSNYKTLKENISPIAMVMSRSSKTLANPSGTTITAKDYGTLGSLAAGSGALLATGGASTGGALVAGGAVTNIALTNLISRIFADPKFAQKIIQRGRILEKQQSTTLEQKVKQVGSKLAENPAVKYQTINYGKNEVLPSIFFDDESREKWRQKKKEYRELKQSTK